MEFNKNGGQKINLNPKVGHIAFRRDDEFSTRKQEEEKAVYSSDFGFIYFCPDYK